ncbi:MAG: ABC transporter substrate-binding protein [Candidatus Riflebacteria bacterium]|nr:ABC transporter substrate-binding protein [Candidatus Riflebacteria bacterium]
MKKMLSLLIIFVILIGFIGCGEKTVGKTVEKKPLKIAITVWAPFAHAFIAQDKGIFRKNNVDVELIFKKSSPETLDLFVNGEVDGIFHSFGTIILFRSKGAEAKVVYVTNYSVSGDAIVGQPNLNSLSELDGKTVSVEEFNSFSHFFVQNALLKAGVEEGKVKFKNVPADAVVKALDEKQVDAGHVWDPEVSRATKKGYKVLAEAGDQPGIVTDVLFFSKKALDERSAEIQGVVKSLIEARNYVDNNREESIKLMAPKMEMTVEEVVSGLEGSHLIDLHENLEIMTETATPTAGKPSLFYTATKMVDFYLKHGQLSQAPDVRDFMEAKFIKELINK